MRLFPFLFVSSVSLFSLVSMPFDPPNWATSTPNDGCCSLFPSFLAFRSVCWPLFCFDCIFFSFTCLARRFQAVAINTVLYSVLVTHFAAVRARARGARGAIKSLSGYNRGILNMTLQIEFRFKKKDEKTVFSA